MSKHFTKIKIAFLILALVSWLFPLASQVEAGNLTNEKDTMSRLKISEAANHTIEFNLLTAIASTASSSIQINFADGSTIPMALDFTDIDLGFGAATRTLLADGSTCTAATDWTVATSSGSIITLTSCNDTVSAGSSVTIEIGTNATDETTGDQQITNPSSAAEYLIELTHTPDTASPGTTDTGTIAVPIIADDQVVVSATVTASITFSISTNTLDLGTLSTGNVQAASHTITTSTNASSGYVTTILEDGNLRDGANEITDVADSVITNGNEEYGLASTDGDDANVPFADITDCQDGVATQAGDAITGSTQNVAYNGGPISSDTHTMCYSAAITVTTEAGSYQHTVTFISTGTF